MYSFHSRRKLLTLNCIITGVRTNWACLSQKTNGTETNIEGRPPKQAVYGKLVICNTSMDTEATPSKREVIAINCVNIKQKICQHEERRNNV